MNMNRKIFFDTFCRNTFDSTRQCCKCKKTINKLLEVAHESYSNFKPICKECFCDKNKSYALFFSTYFIDRLDKESIVTKKEIFDKTKYPSERVCSVCLTDQKYLLYIEGNNYEDYYICEKCFIEGE